MILHPFFVIGQETIKLLLYWDFFMLLWNDVWWDLEDVVGSLGNQNKTMVLVWKVLWRSSSPSSVTSNFTLSLLFIRFTGSISSFSLVSQLPSYKRFVFILFVDLMSLLPDHVLFFCAFFLQYFSFIMVILWFSAFPLAACFLLKHHIHGRDEPLPHRPECKFNIAFSLLSDVHNLSQYL